MVEELQHFFIQGWKAWFDAAVTLLPIGCLFLLLGILTKGRTVLSDMRRAVTQTSLNLQIMVVNFLVFGALSAPISQALVSYFHRTGAMLYDLSVWQSLPTPFVVVAGVVIGDFVAYWRHRLEHSHFLWPWHVMHHSDTELTWLSSERSHPVGRCITILLDYGVLLLLGLPAEAILASAIVHKNYAFLLHADLPWTYGPLGKVFVSPAMHRWHHATDRSAHDSNYAGVFAIFDLVFGTYRVPGPCKVPLGVDAAIPPTLVGQLLYPFASRHYLRGQVKRSAQAKP